MRAIDVLGMCFRNLWKRKLRTLLTLLGVMIGTGSIVLMISLGLATDAQFAQMIEDMNLDMTVIRVWPQWDGIIWSPDGDMQQMEQRELTDESANRIARIPGVLVATPMLEGWMLFRSGPYAMMTSIMGIRPKALALMGYNLEYGRLLEEGGEFEAVFSARSERGFFDTLGDQTWSEREWDFSDDVTTLVDIYNDPIRIYYDTMSFWRGRRFPGIVEDDDFGLDMEEAFTPVRSFDINIVGVIAQTELETRWGGSGTIYMDIETLQTLNRFASEAERRQQEERDWHPHFSAAYEERQTYSQLFVRVASMNDTHRVAEAIRDMGYQANFDGQWIEHQREMTRGIETLLAAIAAVSLAVAAINIANTMITSVTERTHEIGVMKVLGASISDVLKLFLLEAAVIGLMGGILGVGLALGFSYAMNNFDIEFIRNLNMGAPIATPGAEGAVVSLITPWLCGVALAVASGVGVASGFYPAWRATRLSALAAIRGD